MFHSIKSKFLALCLSSLCVLGLAVGAVSLTALTRATSREEFENMNRIAELYRSELDMLLVQTEDVVAFGATGLRNNLGQAADFADGGQRARITAELDSVMRDTLLSLPEARAYYTYYAPELTGGASDGEWCVREDEHSAFRRRQWYQVSEFLPENQQDVAWYRAAAETGHGRWSSPHYSVAQGMYVISYVVPVFREGQFLGVVGADLNFLAILRSLEQRQVYETGYAFLTDETGKTHYHIESPQGVEEDHLGARLLDQDVIHGSVSADDALSRYLVNGMTYDVATCMLRNGMELRVIAPTSEVQREARATVLQFLSVLIFCLIFFAVVTLVITQRITRHLQALSSAAREIAHGNLDVQIHVESDDEVGRLAGVLQHTVDSLARLHRLTFNDGLTGILNRLGIDKALEDWHAQAQGTPAVLISLDIDDFKFINDLLGHAAGDEALRALARRLRDFFGRTALVARNGGDEFTVLLPATTAAQAERLLSELTQTPQHYLYGGVERSFTLSIGYVSYPDQAESLRDLTRYADAALYATKLKGKNGFSRYAAEQEQVDRAKLSFSLRDISQNLPGAIIVCSAADGKVLYANDEAFRLLGCTDLDDFAAYTQKDVVRILYPGDRTETIVSVRSQTAKGEARQAYVRCRVRTKEGAVRYVLVFARKRASAYYGEVYYIVMVEEKEPA
ncbi:diguanylate cyclase domain-containing protein [Selenomonas sp.]|uniref:diguanylate cyclase domain-containing protein n=1 Tax=Selenomonas sp. TaxID=2053611 RepID=UPI003A0FCDF0